MAIQIVVNLAVSFIAILGILNETRPPGKPRWFLGRRFIRFGVITAVGVALLANLHLSAQDRSHSQFLQSTLDSLRVRMGIIDQRLMQFNQEKVAPAQPRSQPELSLRNAGNVAGYVKDSQGRIVPHVNITRVATNAQTSSHPDGAFIVVSVYAGDILRFHREGCQPLDYHVRASDFEKLVQVILTEE